MVRFVDRGLNSTAINYIKNRSILPGLLNHLQKNLELQERLEQNKATESAGTDIYMDDARYISGKAAICTVTKASCLMWRGRKTIPALPEAENGISLATVFGFNIYKDRDLDPKGMEEFNRFKELPSYSLFASHVTSETDDYGNEYAVYEFAMDFGQDAEGAAILISEIAHKVYGCNLDKSLEYYTDSYERLEETRKAIANNGAIETTENNINIEDSVKSLFSGINKKWFFIAVGIVLLVLLILLME